MNIRGRPSELVQPEFHLDWLWPIWAETMLLFVTEISFGGTLYGLYGLRESAGPYIHERINIVRSGAFNTTPQFPTIGLFPLNSNGVQDLFFILWHIIVPPLRKLECAFKHCMSQLTHYPRAWVTCPQKRWSTVSNTAFLSLHISPHLSIYPETSCRIVHYFFVQLTSLRARATYARKRFEYSAIVIQYILKLRTWTPELRCKNVVANIGRVVIRLSVKHIQVVLSATSRGCLHYPCKVSALHGTSLHDVELERFQGNTQIDQNYFSTESQVVIFPTSFSSKL